MRRFDRTLSVVLKNVSVGFYRAFFGAGFDRTFLALSMAVWIERW